MQSDNFRAERKYHLLNDRWQIMKFHNEHAKWDKAVFPLKRTIEIKKSLLNVAVFLLFVPKFCCFASRLHFDKFLVQVFQVQLIT